MFEFYLGFIPGILIGLLNGFVWTNYWRDKEDADE